MSKTIAWIRVLSRLLRYFAYRLGLAQKPTFMDLRREAESTVCQMRRWCGRLRIVHPERCPRTGPAVFAGNHCFAEDPFVMYHAVTEVTEGAVMPRFMMREGIFSSSALAGSRLFDVDEFATLFGALLISRDKVQLSQLKPFVKVLRDGESFLIYPTRTRSRTGAIVEFPEGLEEPGGVSFFVTQAQRARPGLRVAVVPLTRSDNLVNERITLEFGEPQFLAADASREEQREFDFQLVKRIADAVELNVPQVLAAILYLRCLHGLPPEADVEALEGWVAGALAEAGKSHRIDPDAQDLPRELRRALKWLAGHGMLRLRGGRAVLDPAAILSSPPPDRNYRRNNPVKYLANQILHLPDVIAAAEAPVLAEMKRRPAPSEPARAQPA